MRMISEHRVSDMNGINVINGFKVDEIGMILDFICTE